MGDARVCQRDGAVRTGRRLGRAVAWAGIGPLLTLTGDVSADMARIRAFYADKAGKYPDQFTPPRLREEDAAARDEAAR